MHTHAPTRRCAPCLQVEDDVGRVKKADNLEFIDRSLGSVKPKLV
jgi:hypothetical protein